MVAVSVDSTTNVDSSTLLSLKVGLGLVFRNLLMYSAYLAFYTLSVSSLSSTDWYVGRALVLLAATITAVGADLSALL